MAGRLIHSYRLTEQALGQLQGESPFQLVYETAIVLPVEVGVNFPKITHFKEERNEALMREALNLMEEEREISHLKVEKYKSKI
ncbi:hypothetical protein ACS0TY_010559 [Phlomoides rotata]